MVAKVATLSAARPLEWGVTFDPTAQVVVDLRPATMLALADKVKSNATFLNEYRALEANGRWGFVVPLHSPSIRCLPPPAGVLPLNRAHIQGILVSVTRRLERVFLLTIFFKIFF